MQEKQKKPTNINWHSLSDKQAEELVKQEMIKWKKAHQANNLLSQNQRVNPNRAKYLLNTPRDLAISYGTGIANLPADIMQVIPQEDIQRFGEQWENAVNSGRDYLQSDYLNEQRRLAQIDLENGMSLPEVAKKYPYLFANKLAEYGMPSKAMFKSVKTAKNILSDVPETYREFKRFAKAYNKGHLSPYAMPLMFNGTAAYGVTLPAQAYFSGIQRDVVEARELQKAKQYAEILSNRR